jgi:hypothetical protein
VEAAAVPPRTPNGYRAAIRSPTGRVIRRPSGCGHRDCPGVPVHTWPALLLVRGVVVFPNKDISALLITSNVMNCVEVNG